ncbi:MAG: nucleotidyltransferase domain-containing protein [Actinomycetota bacterium]
MNLSEPTRSLSPTLHLAVLATLARTHGPVSGRGLARLLEGKASQRGVADALKHLVFHGLVIRDDHPPSASFSLNRDHVAAGIAELLGGLKDTLHQRCSAEVASWAHRPLWAALFGSIARGEGDASSDVDLALVVPDELNLDGPEWVDQLGRLAERVRLWTGNGASVVVFTRAEFLTSGEPLVRQIRSEGVTVWGHRPRGAR